jgi:hypothetical protein
MPHPKAFAAMPLTRRFPRGARAALAALAMAGALAMAALLPSAALAQASIRPAPAAQPPLQAVNPNPPPPLAATPAPAAPGAAQTITWDQLVPRDWDPMKEFRDVNLSMLDDGDPRAMALMKRLREVWDSAPTNPEMVGRTVRIPGFVVPLEDSKDGMKEFLLVPYFGACIHSPPPPANQIIHVLPRQPVRGLRSMAAVWITGPLTQDRVDSYMGVAGYRVEALSVLPYEERQRQR